MKKKLVKEKFTEIEKSDILYHKRIKQIIDVLTDVENEAIKAGYKFIETDLYGNRLGNKLDIIGAREETDEEYEKRVEKSEKAKAAAKARAETKKNKKEEKERKLLEKLKEKYGEE